jgi:hypothetical protein
VQRAGIEGCKGRLDDEAAVLVAAERWIGYAAFLLPLDFPLIDPGDRLAGRGSVEDRNKRGIAKFRETPPLAALIEAQVPASAFQILGKTKVRAPIPRAAT